MYCKNCGEELNQGAAVCLKCGVASGKGDGFCKNCGKELMKDADVCVNCGTAVGTKQVTVVSSEQKSKVAAGILGILLGSLGVHNFYLGYTGKAVAQLLISLLTCGFGAAISSIWGIIEGIMILTGSISVDAKGVPLKD